MASSTTAEDSLEFFEREIRPILANRCYECHADEARADSAHLRLDYAGGWQKGGDSGPAIDTDAPAQSLLLRAISYEDPELQMPPRSKLPEREIRLLRKWISAGAPAPEEQAPRSGGGEEQLDIEARRRAHWAWQPVERPRVPGVKLGDWPRDTVDRFILARLEAAGLQPADETDRATWLRRVTYHLTGLPPTVEERQQFLADQSPEAYQKVVDRLLASPAFGECWGQHWLDLMRYAETRGHEQDFAIPHAWRYRDYVIRALNANVPYDQFVVEHIAGDLLSEPRIDPETRTNQSIQATGWWHLGEATHAPVDIRGEEADRIDNQIDVFGKAFLGLTVACARCHDHKFDAISTADYYALCGFVQSSSYQEVDVADPKLQARLHRELSELNHRHGRRLLERYAAQARPRLEQLTTSGSGTSAAGELVAAWEAMVAAPAAAGAEEAQTVVDFRSTARPPAYGDWRTSGVAFGAEPAQVGDLLLPADDAETLQVVERPVATNRLASPRFTGLYRTRTFEVTGASVWYRYRGTADVFLAVDSHRTVAGPLHTICPQKLDSPDQWAWFRHPADDYLGHRVHVDFKPTGPFELAEVRVASDAPVDPPSPSTTGDPRHLPDAVLAFARALEAVVEGAATESDARLVNWLLAHDEVLPPIDEASQRAWETAVEDYRAERQALEAQIPEPQYALALLDGSGENEYVHVRGSHKRLAPDATPRRWLTALGGEFPIDQGSGRLALARRLTSTDNPLFARVMVNRVWAHLMGGGIVPTVDNFGVLGEPPTHPELLDHLACEFVDSRYDTKQLIRRLVLSSTYRQASRPAAEIDRQRLDSADPANKLLHATRVRRLSAEAIRDALFAVSGQLNRQRFGPSVPVQITDFMRHNRSPEGSGPIDGDRRRSIYIEVRRNGLNHFLAAFDKPMPFTTVGFRNQSNSASQPLMLLNDPLVHRLVRAWAEQLTTEFSTDRQAVEHAYLAAYAREPTPEEVSDITEFIAARQTGHSAGDEPPTAARQAAWCDVCLALVNSKEFVFLQ